MRGEDLNSTTRRQRQHPPPVILKSAVSQRVTATNLHSFVRSETDGKVQEKSLRYRISFRASTFMQASVGDQPHVSTLGQNRGGAMKPRRNWGYKYKHTHAHSRGHGKVPTVRSYYNTSHSVLGRFPWSCRLNSQDGKQSVGELFQSVKTTPPNNIYQLVRILVKKSDLVHNNRRKQDLVPQFRRQVRRPTHKPTQKTRSVHRRAFYRYVRNSDTTARYHKGALAIQKLFFTLLLPGLQPLSEPLFLASYVWPTHECQ